VVAGALAALGVALYVPAVAAIFRFAPPAAGDLGVAAAAGIAGVVLYDLARQRALARRA
jgi:hypothetical protein